MEMTKIAESYVKAVASNYANIRVKDGKLVRDIVSTEEIISPSGERLREEVIRKDVPITDITAGMRVNKEDFLELAAKEDAIFRLSSGAFIDLSNLERDAHPDQIINLCRPSYKDLFENDDPYYTDDLPTGVHIILGKPGSGKSGFSRDMAIRKDIGYFEVFERRLTPETRPKFSQVRRMQQGPAYTLRGIENALRSALREKVAIIDSIRFIALFATGFPALIRGVNSGIFAFVQWLNILAENEGATLFLVISTEVQDQAVVSLYEDYLFGAANSVLTMMGYGNTLFTRADKARGVRVSNQLSAKLNFVTKQDTTESPVVDNEL